MALVNEDRSDDHPQVLLFREMEQLHYWSLNSFHDVEKATRLLYMIVDINKF